MKKAEAISALRARRLFLRRIGGAALAAGTPAVAQKVTAKSESAAAGKSFPTPDYDWTKRQWAFGVDATKCIGCLRCVEACKVENEVPLTAHHFRTWVERYVYLEGENRPRIDSH
ncbi:MAG TPA: 4Fe-4S binding protein, partial [Burkholderiales bacterium]|nr:4Fe-4S binding protein [Burkholderiales bacterium]